MSAALERSVDLMIAVASAAALWFGAQQVLKATLTPGELLVFLFYFKRGFRPMRDYAKYSARIAKAAAAAERVTAVLDEAAPSCAIAQPRAAAPDFHGEIEFDDVTFSYADGSTGLRNVSFRIAAGENVVIAGASGSGKTTLLNLLCRLYTPTQGTISIDGVPIDSYELSSYRARLNVVLQDGTLFSASVSDNIRLLSPDASDDDVAAAARLAGADEFIERLPAGYDTELGERGLSLSRGQRQRIALARAAIRPAPLLLLDEPTTGLDAANEMRVIAAIDTLARSATTILVTHRPPIGFAFDRVLLVEDGTISEVSDAERLSNDADAFRQLQSRSVPPVVRPAGALSR